MSKPFKTIEEQIKLLESRDLIIKDREQCRKVLLFNNYYNIVNGYGRFLIDKNLNKYTNNCSFDDIVSLFHFDRDLKSLFYRKTMKVESRFKSIVSYVFSKNYRDDFNYLDTDNYCDSNKFKRSKLINKLVNTIEYNKKSSTSLKHNLSKYKTVPFWVLVDYMYFSDIVNFYENLKVKDQNEIARYFSDNLNNEYQDFNNKILITPEQLVSYSNNVRQIRNVAAHDGFLFGARTYGKIKYNSILHGYFEVSNSEIDQTLYDAYISMFVFLDYNHFVALHNGIRKNLRNLERKVSANIFNKTISEMGFPLDFHKSPALPTRRNSKSIN